jgi:hypothetical protein
MKLAPLEAVQLGERLSSAVGISWQSSIEPGRHKLGVARMPFYS